jgi:hypothetical protein
MQVPVLIITYNRFENVLRVLDILSRHGQKSIYISVDDYPRDSSGFNVIEEFLQTHHFDYKILKWETNVGCDINVMKGVRWFFEHVERGVILEDDCIPEGALFSFITIVQHQEMIDQNLSFFSTDIENTTPHKLQQVYLPVYWGWYSNRTFFNEFDRFLFDHKFTFSHLVRLFRSPILLKVKLTALLNYFSFRVNKKGVAWDGVLFYYSIIMKKPFIIPSCSYIKNNGFGDFGSTFTHTHSAPKWYSKIKFAGDIYKGEDLSFFWDHSKNNRFLSHFFADVTNNKFKLFGSVVKAYLGYRNKK